MKAFKLVSFLMIMVFIFSASCGKSSQGEWLIKMDGEPIGIDELNSIYYAHHKQFFQQFLNIFNMSNDEIDKYAADPEMQRKIPTLNKQIFLNEIINQRIIYKKAVESGISNNKELKALLKIAEETATVQFFVREQFKNDINVSDKEVEEFYTQNRARFKMEPIDVAEKKIRQFLSAQKLSKKMMKYVETVREETKIERNKSIDSMLETKVQAPLPVRSEKK